MRIWLQNVFGVIKMIKSLAKTFLVTYYEIFLSHTSFSENCQKPYFHTLVVGARVGALVVDGSQHCINRKLLKNAVDL